MNIEENRLRTFTTTWPTNTPVHPEDLARNGFFATDNFLEAECHWCHVRISDWQYGDIVMDRHASADPQCPYLLNYYTTDNVPLAVNTAQQNTTDGSDEAAAANVPVAAAATTSVDLHIEANRLATFKNWPNANISPESLAKAGFFYLQRNDEVKCVWCKGVMAQWEENDNAFDEHKRFFPNCVRVQLGPLIEIASDGIRDLGVQRINPPFKPKFASLDTRLRSYSNWPIGEVQSPEALAQAGLYYQGVDDQVRCFHCNIGLRSWQKEDDPWFEHAKWYTQCQFVRLVKGAAYVERVQRECFLLSNVDEAMKSDAVRQAIEIGIDVRTIRLTVYRKLAQSGSSFHDVETLMNAIFSEDDFDDEEAAAAEQLHRVTSCSDREDNKNNGTVTMTAIPNEDLELEQEMLPCSSHRMVGADADTCAGTMSAIDTDVQQPKRELSPQRRLSLEEENRKLKDARLCKVCLDEEVGVVFLPCGHLVTCVQCAPGVTNCPMCRTDIKGFVRTFLA